MHTRFVNDEIHEISSAFLFGHVVVAVYKENPLLYRSSVVVY